MDNTNTICYNVDEDIDLAVDKALELYYEGKVFVYPTDTIYGFGSNPFNADVITKISRIKNRPLGKQYIMLINDMETLLKYIDLVHESHIDFLMKIWPNPVSVVLHLNSKSSKVLGYEDAAFRIPNHGFCMKMLKQLKMPLISTSVNRADEEPLNDHRKIFNEFQDEVDGLFYTTRASFKVSSTLIDLRKDIPSVIREGRVPFADIMKIYESIES